MTFHILSRLLSLTAGALAIGAIGMEARGQEASTVAVKVVKYAELAKTVRQNAGRVVVVDFWSDTCIPCKKKFPHLVEMSQKYASQGLVVIAVSVDADPQKSETQETALRFLRAQKATFTNLMLDEPEQFWGEKLGIQSLPCVFVFSREGKWRKFTGDDVGADDIDRQIVDWLKAK